jgi:hypothetical protein
MKKIAIATALALLFGTPAFAESDVNTGAGPATSAAAKLDFQVVIPRVLFLQVGTGTAQADNTAVDKIVFTVPAANLGDASAIAGVGGDLTAGEVSVRLFGNGGDISLTSASPGGADLVNAAGDSIPWTELAIATAAGPTTGGFSATAIAHPAINDPTGVTVTATSKVIRQSGTWKFSYKNTKAYAEGNYGGTNQRNSRVTYTAAMP